MLSGIGARLRSLWRGVRSRATVEADMNAEFQLHIDLRSRDLMRSGLSAAEAIRQARAEFGDRELHREDSRRSRGLHHVDLLRFSWLDVRLGGRMMIKYPGLTLVAGLGMAVAIAIGTGYTSTMRVMLAASLPLPEGDRIVALQNWDTGRNNRGPTSLHDFLTWRDELRTVDNAGAYRTITRNLVAADGSADPLTIAEMSASGFRVARVPPALGRFFLAADEAPGAPPIVVIGHDLWTQRFTADSTIIGRELQLGTRRHIVVGVMPEGFGFPINHHVWIPLQVEPIPARRRDGPSLTAFGRLAPGATLAQARAELDVIGHRTALDFPETNERLQAQVHPYARPSVGMDKAGDVQGARMVPLLTTLLLIVICVNVAVLIYARTEIRHGEIVVRSALGATRRRVVAQLFAEALVLSLAAAVLGLAMAAFALNKANVILASMFGGQLPFWMALQLSLGSFVQAAGLAVLAALITGAVPALKATGARLHGSLQRLSAGGGSVRLGRVWTVMVIGQVAVAVALLPVAVYQGAVMYRYGTVDAGFAADEYLSFVVNMETTDQAPFAARYTERVRELMRRVRTEPGVAEVTYASSAPGKERQARLELEPAAMRRAPDDSLVVTDNIANSRFALVDASFLDVYGIPLVAGRAFTAADADSSGTAIIVNQSFVGAHFPDGNALGRRLRHVAPREAWEDPGDVHLQRWFEVVGVIPDFPSAMIPEQVEAKAYQAAFPGTMYPATLSVRLRGANQGVITARLRQVAAALDPALQVRNVRRLDALYEDDQSAIRLTGLGIAIATLSVLLLSAGGIYAMMSLAVTRRRREIGIRAALGANPRHILASVFARAIAQLGVGIGVGLTIILLVDAYALRGALRHNALLVTAVSAIILAVGVLASLGPARRGLRIQPAEVLKQE